MDGGGLLIVGLFVGLVVLLIFVSMGGSNGD